MLIFAEQSFDKQEFKGISSQGENILRKEFSNCVFKSCNFNECAFKNSLFIDCVFTCCNLSNIKVDNCSFRGVVFDDCKLTNVSFAVINPFLLNWAFKKCKIEFCNFGGLKMKHSAFIESVVRGTDFINVDLEGADFAFSDLQNSKFHNAVLENANFVGARNYYIDPTSNRMKKAKFSAPEVLALLAGFDINVE
jgi:fluoroquinolone resistance protein